LEKECKSNIPFVGAVELATLAKAHGVITDARVGLADICAAVLHVRLDKSSPLRVRTDWDNNELSAEQLHYAALDAWVSLKIHQHLSQTSLPKLITNSTLPGTPISVLQDDGQVIAHGDLSLNLSTAPCNGVNLTPTRARVTIKHVIAPAAILPLHAKSLASLGSPPFDVVVKRSKLFEGAKQNADASHIPPSPMEVEITNQNLLEFLSKPVSADENWTDDVDEPVDITEETDDAVSTAQVDRLSLEEGLTLLHEMDTNPSLWSRSVRSRVIMDIWHAMARIKIPKEHGFRRPFARALRDAIFIPDGGDKTRISHYLESIGSSWDDVLRFKATWLWKRCRRTVPPPEQLYPLVKEVYTTFGPLLDAKTQKPLFNSRAWKDAGNILKAIQAGFLSDPPGIALYFQIGVDKKHGNLPIYRCA